MCGRGQHNIVKQFKKTKVQKKKKCATDWNQRVEQKAKLRISLEKITAFHYFYCILLYIYIYQRRQWHRTPVLLPGKIPWMEEPGGLQSMGSLESGTTERLPFHFSLSCIGEGNGNPLQCSCVENPRDGGAWGAAVYGVAQSRTRLKRLSSSSSIYRYNWRR